MYRVERRATLGTCQPNDERAFLDEIESLDYAALRIFMHPWLAGLPILPSCLVP